MARAVLRIPVAVGVSLIALVLAATAPGPGDAWAQASSVTPSPANAGHAASGPAASGAANAGPAASGAARSAGPGAGSGGTATVTLEPGVVLPPGTYDVVIQVPGSSVRGKVTVGDPSSGGAQPAPAASTDGPGAALTDGPGAASHGASAGAGEGAASPTAAGSAGTVTLIMIIGLVVAGLGLILVTGYFKYLAPRRHVRAYREALALLAAKQYRQAVPALTSLESKLPDRLRGDARFFISFGFLQMGDLDEARHRLVSLYREDPGSPNVAYLLGYVHAKQGDYDAAEPVLEAMHRNNQLDRWTARRLYALVEFHRAAVALREGRIDAAAELFEKVEQLGEYRDRIPSDLRNRHAVLGARALFEKNVEAALGEFQSLERAAGRCQDAEQRTAMLATAKLGLALVRWIEDDADDPEAVERDLVATARYLDPDGPLTVAWPEGAEARPLADQVDDLGRKAGLPGDVVGRDRTLRDIHLVRAAAVLRAWAGLQHPQAVESADDNRRKVLERLGCALARDPGCGDAFLVAGLLRYYLPAADGDQERGITELRRAQELGVRDPRALALVNQHDRLAKANRDAVDRYLQVLDRYLGDSTVRAEVRADLVARLSRYGRIREWDRRPDLAAARTVAATVAEMHDRSRLLMERVAQLMRTVRDPQKIDEARGRTADLERQSRALRDHADGVERSEADLLELVGGLLLVD